MTSTGEQTTSETSQPATGCPMSLPMDRDIFNPPPSLKELQKTASIAPLAYPDGEGWIVTGYETARTVLSDPRFVSWPGHWPVHPPERTAEGLMFAVDDDPDFPAHARTKLHDLASKGEIVKALHDDEIVGAVRTSPPRSMALIQSDGARHNRMRRALSGHFTPRRVQEHRSFIESSVQSLLDEMEQTGPPADLVSGFSLPLASLTICSLFGVPGDEREQFEGPTKVLLNPRGVDPEVDAAARQELFTFAENLVAEKLKNPGDDVPSRLIAAGDIGRNELVGTVILLLTAGHDTTTSQLPLSVAALLNQREKWEQLVSGEANVRNSVEEMLRYLSIVQIGGAPRTALEDVEVAGVTVKKGQRVLVSLPAVNRDPSVFENPDEIQLDRHASLHMAFGFGIHQCLGQQLTRLELQTGLAGLVQRFPTLDLAVPLSELSALPGDRIVYGLEKLPVTW